MHSAILCGHWDGMHLDSHHVQYLQHVGIYDHLKMWLECVRLRVHSHLHLELSI